MLQDLVKAYGEAYTAAITPSLIRRSEAAERDRDTRPETPVKAGRGRGWRVLLSAFL